MSRLAAIDLVKRFKRFTAVDHVSVQVESGEVVGLLGPNGAGKTTTFYMMTGLVPAGSGIITLDGKDITAYPMHARARLGVGYLPQEPSVFRKLSVADNLMAVLESRPGLSRAERREIQDSLLRELNITHLAEKQGVSLSGGERRRVEIARALAAEPRFILLDEPFAGVDPISVIDIQRIIEHLTTRNIGVLITDHNVRETLGICGRAYILSSGKVIADGTPDAILADKQVRDVYLGDQFRM
ncbi:MAG: LPS export ABC transporter ATP-binding protein [Gammaproteobacteria bacterium]